jgi:prepilin-type processing-associated H-X9-DG protein
VTDGNSSTILFDEGAYGKLGGDDAIYFGWWTSGIYGDVIFSTFYPMNPQSRVGLSLSTDFVSIDIFESAASSLHPGGVNVGFADGSVRFIKDSINTMPFDQSTGTPIGVIAGATQCTSGSAPIYSLAPGTQLGIWQALSTRAGGKVISADSYESTSPTKAHDEIPKALEQIRR